MTGLETHTPLETLLLFQSLDPAASDPPSFTRISDSLKNNNLIRESESYNPTRLDPESLTQLYLRLMKEEARAEVNGNKGVNNAEEQQPPTRKKPTSPLLNTVNEASRHTHLLPSLLNRLYFRYRNHAIKAIEGEEYRYRLLQRDIQEINRGEWDARLQLEEATSKKDIGNGGFNSIQTLLRRDSDVEKPSSEGVQHSAKSPQRQDETVAPQNNQRAITSEDLPTVVAGVPVDSQHEKQEHGKQKPSEAIHVQSNAQTAADGPQPPEVLTLSPARPTQESQQLPVAQDNQHSQSISSEKNLPFLPPRQPTNPGYSLPSPDVNRRIPYPLSESQASVAPSPNPRLQQTHLPPHDRSSQSPITLPPLAGMLRKSGSPLASLDNLADMSGQQQYRPNPPLPSSRPVQLPVGQAHHPIQLPQPRNFPMQVYPYYDTQQSFGIPYPYGQGHIPPYHPPNQGGMPSYQGHVPSPGRGSMYGSGTIYQSPTPSYSQYPAYSQTSSYQQTPVQAQFSRSQAPRFPDQSTPVSRPSDKRRPPRPSPIDTSTTSTRWKNAETPSSMRPPGSPTRPRPEEISPISEKAPSPAPEILPSQNKQSTGQGSKRPGAVSSRIVISRGHGPRAASAASSTAAGSAPARTRSQSLLSHADELSIDNNPSQIHKIKPEPPATPVGDEDVSVTDITPDESSRKSTRRRRETLRGLEMTEINRTGTKRKRGTLETPVRSSSPHHFNNRANHVLGSRNFPRTSATIMNDITGHKLASMFAKPITDREAPGYKDLIFRPQDLKSIKSAIVAGSKALVSAADSAGASASGEVGSPAAHAGSGTPSVKSASVWIPETADVRPPKGIVNSAQLEKELMRMFANAIMFNPDPKRGFGSVFREGRGRHGSANERRGEEHGEEGDAGDRRTDEDDEGSVVKDTREMFEAVERGVADWRAAERAVEDLGPGTAASAAGSMKGPLARLRGAEKEEDGEVDELAGEDVQPRDDEDLGGGKRRRR